MTNRFRVWDGTELYEPPHNFVLMHDGSLKALHNSSVADCVGEEWRVMLYTGLDDKEGRPIYEGDIVDVYMGESAAQTSGRGVIKWSDDHAGWVTHYRTGRYGDKYRTPLRDPVNKTAHEVIGNRYEDPELIEQT